MTVASNYPEDYRPYYWSGKIHTRLNKSDKAIDEFRTAVQLNPRHIDAHLSLALLYNQSGKIDFAIEEFKSILEQSPDHKEATYLLNKAIREQYQNSDTIIKY